MNRTEEEEKSNIYYYQQQYTQNKVIEGEKPSCSIYIDEREPWSMGEREKCGERTQNGLFKRD